MKRLTLFFSFFVCLTYISAQHLIFHTGGGLTSHYGGSTKNIGAFKIGAGYEFELNQTLSIEPSLLFYAKGWKDKDKTVLIYDAQGNVVYDDLGNPMTGKMNVTSNTNYLVLPIVFNYYIPLSIPNYIIFTAGPYVAYGVGGKVKTRGDTSASGAARYYYDHNTFSQSDMHHFDAGITTGIGYEFNRQFDAGIETDFGLVNVNTAGAKNFSILLTLAYHLEL